MRTEGRILGPVRTLTTGFGFPADLAFAEASFGTDFAAGFETGLSFDVGLGISFGLATG